MYIKEQLGHHSIQVTVDIYGHLVPGGNKAAVDRLDDEQNPQSSRQNSRLSQQIHSHLEPRSKSSAWHQVR